MMPPKPAWFHRLPEILDVLTSMDAGHLDRYAVEQLFGTDTSDFAGPVRFDAVGEGMFSFRQS